MNLFEKVLGFVKSFGHKVESEEHKLLNDFVVFLGNESSIIENFLQSKGLDKDGKEKEVISKFIASIVPAPEPVQVAPVEVAPVEAAPVESAPAVEAPASVTINVEDPSSATVQVTADRKSVV